MARLLTLTIALMISCCQTWALPAHQQKQQPQQIYLSDSKIHIRPVTEADLDDITTVIVDAFRPSPLWRYVFQHQDEYKEYQWKCMRKNVDNIYWHAPNNTFANVISVSLGHGAADTLGKRSERVVAIAIWRIMEPGAGHSGSDSLGTLGARSGSAECLDHLDANLTRALDFNRQFLAAEEHYIWSLPEKQMHLALLGTHPDWDGHGFGAAHCEWGMEMAKKMDVPTTLMATPAGWPLYDSLGFDSVANVTIETLGELEDLWYEYMRYDS